MGKRYEVLVIGGGPGGTPAAMALAQEGKRVLLVEATAGLGGTCLFEGCIPSKILHETAQRLRAMARAGEFGIRVPHPLVQLDWQKLQARKRAILQRRATAAMHRANQLSSLDLQFGRARLLGARRAVVEPHNGESFEVTFENCIIATGSVPNPLPVPGGDLPQVFSSDEILDAPCVPERLVVIGGGPIGVELAQMFHALGSDVSVMQRGPRILPGVDEELAVMLQQHLINQGIKLYLDCNVKRVCHTGQGVFVQYDVDGGCDQIYATAVLAAVGRRPNVEGLGLEHTTVALSRHAIQVDEWLQTTEPGIYAVGDVTGQPMFAHWATAQGLALAAHLLGKERPVFPRPEHNTAVMFSEPELLVAGLNEAQAAEAGFDVCAARYEFSHDARAQIGGCDNGLLKIFYDRMERRILGVQALVEGASALAGEAALLIRAALPLEVVAEAIHPHPTLSEAFVSAARTVLMKHPHRCL